MGARDTDLFHHADALLRVFDELPVLYFGVAHAALALACAAVALDQGGASGFFYHARMLGIVHLVTLGWIAASILGSLYLVGPIALRVWLPATWLDYSACVLVVIGIAGMVAHFWMEDYAGMAWSASTVGTGIMAAGVNVVRALPRATLPRAVSTHIVLAFVSVLGAATMGVLIGFDKVYHFLPGFVFADVFAHAHLAAIGWASVMVVGVAYRLLPMILPAAMPSGRRFVDQRCPDPGLRVRPVGDLAVPQSVHVGVQGRHRHRVLRISVAGRVDAAASARPTPGLPLPDPAVLHAAASFGSLAIASVLGVWLAIAEPSASALRVAMAYGVFGLVGFLAQLIVGMEGRLLPLFAWYWAYANTGYRGPVPSPHDRPSRGGRELVFVLWMFGVPALAGGLAFDAVPLLRAAAWCLLAATLLDAVNVIRILRHAFVTP